MDFNEPGEVWFIELENSRGHEQSGTRPAVVLAKSFGMHTVVPLTTSENGFNFPHTHIINPDSRSIARIPLPSGRGGIAHLRYFYLPLREIYVYAMCEDHSVKVI
jgi:hypothetical protein